jgi:hypothetical protein
MQSHTRAALEAILKSDTTVTPEERKRLLATGEKQPPDHVISHAEAAQRFGRCPRSLDNWVKRGLLKKWHLPGMSRATGFRESEIVALLQAGGGQTVATGPAQNAA